MRSRIFGCVASWTLHVGMWNGGKMDLLRSTCCRRSLPTALEKSAWWSGGRRIGRFFGGGWICLNWKTDLSWPDMMDWCGSSML